MNFAEFVKGKSAVLVGPANYTQGLGLGKTTDSYDLIIRINEGPWLASRHPVDLGSKTDILYHNLHKRYFYRLIKDGGYNKDRGSIQQLAVDRWCKQGVSWVVGPHPWLWNERDGKELAAACESLLPDGIERRKELCVKYKELAAIHGFSPSTGILGVWDILQYEIDSLHVMGLTFFLGGYYEEYCSFEISERLRVEYEMQNHHRPRRDAVVLKYLEGVDDRVSMDDAVRKAMDVSCSGSN